MAPGTDEENPFLARPEEHKVGAANEVYCWMPGNENRECNATCVAYDPANAAEGKSCEALKFLASISSSLEQQVQLAKQAARQYSIAKRTELIEKIPQPPEVK